ncbi:MAG: DUF1858 domain-containing protein [bacterium]|jgi:uncharacterized protein (DUF2249 family)|nr:DUF1858 domain-containing protein [bacterium]
MSEKIAITPETKISVLLDHYPQLEDVLIDMAPAFKKLRNPILRKTIAKVATLRQVAQIGDVSLAALINTLRAEVGQSADLEIGDEAKVASHLPDWFDSAKIAKSLDARPILEAGQHPMSQVLEELKKLKSGEIYELITPFLPAPLIDMAKQKGYHAWSDTVQTDLIKTYFFS